MNETKNTLSAREVQHYREEGYIVRHEPLFPQPKFERLKSIFEESLERYGAGDALDGLHFHDARLLDFLLSDEALDLVEPLIGPDIGLWSGHFISKAAGVGKATPWHEDSSYWNGRVSTMAGICTIWLAIDEATPENGCMKVIPRSHDNGFSDYEPVSFENNIFDAQIKPELIDESKAVYFSLKPNECSLHEARLIHGADANTSPKRRAGYTMRYFPTSSKVFPEMNKNHKIWLARGRDLAGNSYQN